MACLCVFFLDPDWASYKLGVFICLNCSGIHRNLTEISRVKSIRLDFWDDDLVEEIVSWFNAIRAARFSYLKTAFPTASDSEQSEPFKKRWFILDSQDRKLLYFKDPLDAVEKGAIFIGNEEHGYKVTNILPQGIRRNRWKCGITVETPERQFIFTCENEREHREWMEALNQVISKPMSPQDYTTGLFVLQWKPTSDEGDDIGGAAADISEELDVELCSSGNLKPGDPH
ncbi:UNVERIFIED_CONTAM: hypothetical protein FKN15_032960 [Acipenser sinensis]